MTASPACAQKKSSFHTLIARVQSYRKCHGLFSTALRILRSPLALRTIRAEQNDAEQRKKRIFKSPDIEKRFTAIYSMNFWGSTESVSGTGSTLQRTVEFRANLPKLFDKFSVKSIFDAPCGDFNWMRALLKEIDLRYIGGDIVKPLVASHNKKYKNHKTSFVHFDITKDVFPEVDLWFCRDCLFHLSYEDAFRALQNFVHSKIPYILTTTYKNIDGFANTDIPSGDFKLMDLFSSPYHFPDPLDRIDDNDDLPREMCLWTREQIGAVVAEYNKRKSDGIL